MLIAANILGYVGERHNDLLWLNAIIIPLSTVADTQVASIVSLVHFCFVFALMSSIDQERKWTADQKRSIRKWTGKSAGKYRKTSGLQLSLRSAVRQRDRERERP